MDPITKKSFKSLTKTEQVVMVIRSGKEILSRSDVDYFVKLFVLSDIFVEILYELNKATIVKLVTPSKEKIFHDYNIDNAHLNELINDAI